MNQLRTPLLLFFSLLLVLVSVSALAASKVEPRLQTAVLAAASNETIPVIIRLSEKVNVDAYRHLPKKERRRQLVQELRGNSGRSAYSEPIPPLIPTQIVHPFRSNSATDSD